MNSYNTGDAIFALATAWAKSAIAVVRVSGDDCISMLRKAISSKKDITRLSSNTAHYCLLVNPSDGTLVDEIVLTVYTGGHGYTGEESFEISCHGGLGTVKAVLETMAALGFRQALPGEFTLRAFLHGKMDLTRAEAVQELVDSQGKTGRLMALNRLGGALFKRINEIKAIVLEIMSIIEVQLDYSEDEIGEDLSFPMDRLEKALGALESIKATYNTGRLYSQGARVVLAGPSNAGKSSLFNLFLKEERSIVSSIRGTTRDFIEENCTIDGIPVRLFDTAGFRTDSENEIEDEGIRRSKALLDNADLILYLVDSSSDEAPDQTILDDERCIKILNKVDLNDSTRDGFFRLSVTTGLGFPELCNEMKDRLTRNLHEAGEEQLVIENARQRDELQRAIESLLSARTAEECGLPLDIVSVHVQEALEALGTLTGEVTTDDVLDKVFGSFCVGK